MRGSFITRVAWSFFIVRDDIFYFLNLILGSGYHLTVMYKTIQSLQQQEKVVKDSLALISHYCPDAQIQSCAGLEATFLLPSEFRSRYSFLFLKFCFLMIFFAFNIFAKAITIIATRV